MRTYLVNVKGSDSQRLVKAPNRSQAINHVAAELITASVASQDDLERLLPAGVKVEHPTGKSDNSEGGASS